MNHFIPIAVQAGLVVARALVAGVFVVAGVAKVRNRPETRQAVIDFGLPARLAAPAGFLLPLVELLIGVAVLPVSTARWGAGGALAILTVFTVAISLTLARGRAPACRCFGQLSATPVGTHTLARNGVLIALATFIASPRIGPGPSMVTWLGALTASSAALLAGFLGLALLTVVVALLFEILRQQGRILLRLDALEGPASRAAVAQGAIATSGLPVGSAAPDFQVDRLDGEAVALEGLLADAKPVLLLFANPNCGPCQALMPDIARWQREHSAELSIALVSEGSVAENRAKAAEHGVSLVLLQKEREIADSYQAWGTPTAILIRPDGAIGSPAAQGADAIRTLVAQTMLGVAPAVRGLAPRPKAFGSSNGAGHHPPLVDLGDEAPALQLRDLDGKSVSLTAFCEQDTLLLFWNPECGFCERMLDDLRAWDARYPNGALRLVVVSTGSVAQGRSMGLQAQLLLDPERKTATTFDAYGTPMAILLDRNCRKASELVSGSEAIFALADRTAGIKLEPASFGH